MPRSPSTYSLPPGTTPQQPNTVISSSMFNAFADDVAQTFNTVQPIVYGGTGSNDLKLTDTDFGIKDNGDPTKIGQFNASGLPTATTRTYDLPYYSGTLGLVSDIRGQIYGLTLSNNVTDATNDIDIAAGSAVDTTGTVSMLLASALTKRLDAAWAVGNNQGGLDTGSIANTTYHVFLIRRPDTGVVDALFSVSPTAPTLPANYTQFRRLGFIVRVAGAILLFTQYGNTIKLVTGTTSFNSTTPVSNILQTVVGSGGIRVQPFLGVLAQKGTAGDSSLILGDGDAATASNTVIRIATAGEFMAGNITTMFTNTAGQLRLTLFNSSGTFSDVRIFLIGWVDYTL